MAHYLMTLIETSGRHDHQTHSLIEADDVQMVKYHFHRTLRNYGYTVQDEKHRLHGDGKAAELYEINPLEEWEVDAMEDYLPTWTKV